MRSILSIRGRPEHERLATPLTVDSPRGRMERVCLSNPILNQP
jgi:hypothetical protein